METSSLPLVYGSLFSILFIGKAYSAFSLVAKVETLQLPSNLLSRAVATALEMIHTGSLIALTFLLWMMTLAKRAVNNHKKFGEIWPFWLDNIFLNPRALIGFAKSESK